jgi:hypothetical protein
MENLIGRKVARYETGVMTMTSMSGSRISWYIVEEYLGNGYYNCRKTADDEGWKENPNKPVYDRLHEFVVKRGLQE